VATFNRANRPASFKFSKTFTAEILVQMAKYCLPQITYLLIHVFLINFRQGNVKLVLLN
jgi:hypothetical protein